MGTNIRYIYLFDSTTGAYYTQTPGSDISVGDAMTDVQGFPLLGSPLIDRVIQDLVPADLRGIIRDALGDIGAYER